MHCTGAWAAAIALVALPGSRAIDAQSAAALAVSGFVVDSSGRAVAFARITGDGVPERVADDSGRFLVAMPRSGALSLTARRIGFHPAVIRVQINRDTTVRLVMQPLPASLANVQIEAEATVRSLETAGFYERLRDKQIGANTGHFFLPEEIEQRGGGTVVQLLTGTPGLRIERFKMGSQGDSYLAIFGNSRTLGRALCPMTVYLNRSRLGPPAGVSRTRSNVVPPDVSEYVTLREVAGIEVYTRSNTPFEFSMMNGTCGVVVIWTK